jgi:hypothetical protein
MCNKGRTKTRVDVLEGRGRRIPGVEEGRVVQGLQMYNLVLFLHHQLKSRFFPLLLCQQGSGIECIVRIGWYLHIFTR